jgi:hypothetical protein
MWHITYTLILLVDTHMHAICHIHELVTSRTSMSHTWMSHVTNQYVTYMNESRHKPTRVMSHIWMNHVKYTLILLDQLILRSKQTPTYLQTYNPTNLKTCNPTLSYASKPYLTTTIMHNKNVKSDRVCMLQTRSDFTFFLRCIAPGQLATLGGCQNNKVHTATHCNTLQHTTTQQLPLHSSYALNTA